MTPDAEAALKDYLDNDPKKVKYGNRKFTLNDFGLTREDVKEMFKEYIEIMLEKYPLEDIL